MPHTAEARGATAACGARGFVRDGTRGLLWLCETHSYKCEINHQKDIRPATMSPLTAASINRIGRGVLHYLPALMRNAIAYLHDSAIICCTRDVILVSTSASVVTRSNGIAILGRAVRRPRLHSRQQPQHTRGSVADSDADELRFEHCEAIRKITARGVTPKRLPHRVPHVNRGSIARGAADVPRWGDERTLREQCERKQQRQRQHQHAHRGCTQRQCTATATHRAMAV